MTANLPYSVVVGASGNGTISVQTGRQVEWVISQVSIEMTSVNSGTLCALRKNGSLVTPMVAAGDAATDSPPITLWPTDVMTIEWTGAPVGAVGKALIFYDESPYQ